jgi:hypothetical protein
VHALASDYLIPDGCKDQFSLAGQGLDVVGELERGSDTGQMSAPRDMCLTVVGKN